MGPGAGYPSLMWPPGPGLPAAADIEGPGPGRSNRRGRPGQAERSRRWQIEKIIALEPESPARGPGSDLGPGPGERSHVEGSRRSQVEPAASTWSVVGKPEMGGMRKKRVGAALTADADTVSDDRGAMN